jgi:phosphoglycolate phosphatase (TIGR01487 family)
VSDRKGNEKDLKLIALDMDGTLLNHEHVISEGNKKAISEAKELGIHVVISTGRTIMTCRELVEPLKLSSYVITTNGSEIWDSDFVLVERQLLGCDHIQMMLDLTNTHNTSFWAASVNQVWRDEIPEDVTEHDWLKFGFDVPDDDVREKVLEELRKNTGLEISNSSPTNIEVNAVGINKAAALVKVTERLGLTMDNVIAMGDSLNDIAMISEAGVGVAMGNAQDIVKETADWVTDTNEEDGVAKAIKHWVLDPKRSSV